MRVRTRIPDARREIRFEKATNRHVITTFFCETTMKPLPATPLSTSSIGRSHNAADGAADAGVTEAPVPTEAETTLVGQTKVNGTSSETTHEQDQPQQEQEQPGNDSSLSIKDDHDDDDDDDDEDGDEFDFETSATGSDGGTPSSVGKLRSIFWKTSLSMEEDDGDYEEDIYRFDETANQRSATTAPGNSDPTNIGIEETHSGSSKGSFESLHASDGVLSKMHEEKPLVSTENERQILLLMLLAQVCALHDPTPRTFTVHVLELYERGILDRESIGFLFDLGLVPVKLPSSSGLPMLEDGIGTTSTASTTAGVDPSPRPTSAVVHSPTSTKRTATARWHHANTVDTATLTREQEASAIRDRLEQSECAAAGAATTATNGSAGKSSHGYQRAKSDPFPKGVSPSSPSSSSSSWGVDKHPLYLSRYQREFEQQELLNSGSFGHVFRATSKMDGRDYAIKRIVFSASGFSNASVSQVVREVRCLAQCDHPNCVRYYTSWLEPSWVTGSGTAVTSADEVASKQAQRRMLTDIHRMMLEGPEVLDNSSDSPSMSNGFNASSRGPSSASYGYSSAGYSTEWTRGDGAETTFSYGQDDPSWDLRTDSVGDNRHPSNRYNAKTGRPSTQSPNSPRQQSYRYQMCFFIQMQLCRPTTLADWIKERNQMTTSTIQKDMYEPATRVFGQVVKGLAHVHEKGIVHRDLKPANVFAAHDGEFKIGDFGLSKHLQGVHRAGTHGTNSNDTNGKNSGDVLGPLLLPPMDSDGWDSMTAGIGTASYASPEQVSSNSYGPAADVFSLGLILLELFCAFGTEHERIHTFHDCRQGVLPPELVRSYPRVAETILACTNHDPRKRPTSQQLLKRPLFGEERHSSHPKEGKVGRHNGQHHDAQSDKDARIAQLETELAEKDRTIEELRRRVTTLEEGFRAHQSLFGSGSIQSKRDDSPDGKIMVENSDPALDSDGDY